MEDPGNPNDYGTSVEIGCADKHMVSELVFEVTQEADGGYRAECLTADILT